MRVLITGAHFTPAVAVIEELKKSKGVEIVYVGRNTTQEGDQAPSAESEVLPELGVKFIPIITGRLQRDFTVYTIPSILKIPVGFLQALYIILSEKPDIILSFGGYVAVPVIFAGWLFSIPIIIHEQTLVSGLANKISSFFSDKIAVSFKNSEFKGEKVILTGNPLRQDVLSLSHQGGVTDEYKEIFKTAQIEKKPIVLFTGGNQGSHIINQAVGECLDKLIKISSVIHITGDNKFGDFERSKDLQNNHYLVKKWIGREWGAILSKTSLVVSRAGINTLTELAFLGKPAILVPIQNKEQRVNAKFFAESGLAKILPQSRLSGEALLKEIKLALDDLKSLEEKAREAKKIVIPDAVKRLTLETIILAKKPGMGR